MAEDAARQMEVVREALDTGVLANVARLGSAAVLRGQIIPARRCTQAAFVKTEFYPLHDGRPGHRHQHRELATVLEGRLNVTLGDQDYEARAGDWLIARSGVFHGESPLPTGAPARVFWFTHTPTYLMLRVREFHGDGRGRESRARTASDVIPILPPWLRSLWIRPWESLPKVKSWLANLVSWSLFRLTPLWASRSRRHPLVARVRELTEPSAGGIPSVGELARQVGVSPSYLSRVFRAETQITVHDFAQLRRIHRACELLADSDLTMKQITYALGFGSPSTFSQVFRRHWGMSPSAYRQRLPDATGP